MITARSSIVGTAGKSHNGHCQQSQNQEHIANFHTSSKLKFLSKLLGDNRTVIKVLLFNQMRQVLTPPVSTSSAQYLLGNIKTGCRLPLGRRTPGTFRDVGLGKCYFLPSILRASRTRSSILAVREVVLRTSLASY